MVKDKEDQIISGFLMEFYGRISHSQVLLALVYRESRIDGAWHDLYEGV